jgi:3-deoxy-D-manno-octulosonate 8-phosphate phosphatase (KDO 8-P phosphatase)
MPWDAASWRPASNSAQPGKARSPAAQGVPPTFRAAGPLAATDGCYNPDMSKARAKKIKLLLLDVDGVMTDGKLYFVPLPGAKLPPGTEHKLGQGGYGIPGEAVEVKAFHAHDGTGFSLARLGGIKTGLITKRISETVRLRARDLKIEFVYQGSANKLQALHDILQKTGLKAEEVAFVGDDIIDLPVMRACGLAIAVANAREDVKDEAHVITDHRGGEGAVRDAVEYILKAQGTLTRAVEAYISDRTSIDEKFQ